MKVQPNRGLAALSALALGVQAFAGAASGGDLLTGADISYLPLAETEGCQFRDGGAPESFLRIARQNGWNVLRARLWVAPDARPERQVSDLAHVTALGKRIKEAGFQFLLDLHYSDTWADPGAQKKPAAWADLPFPQLVAQVHDYSRDVLAALRTQGAMPDLVQVGNEIRNGLLYGSGLNGAGPEPGGGFHEGDHQGATRALVLLDAAMAGLREGSAPLPPPLMVLHLPDGQQPGFIRSYLAAMEKNGRAISPPVHVDFDVIGLSYYPAQPWDRKAGYDPWHLSHLAESMNYIATSLHKPVLIAETAWPHAGSAPTIPGTPEYPFTPEGQVQFYRALLQAVRDVPLGMGKGVVLWTKGPYDHDSVFDAGGNALPAMRTLGQK